uniref:Putative capsid morphogenesis protein n=1 Tax=viral metagenome TaxID=1070528 RepID=A0A6H1ZC49_9ZZZZ
MIAQFQAERDALAQGAMTQLQDSYRRVYLGLKREQDALLAQIVARRTAGQEVSAAWLRRQQNYKRLLRETEDQIQRYAAVIEDAVGRGQYAQAMLAQAQAEQLVQAALGGFPPEFQAQIMGTFNRMPKEAIEAMVAALQADSPLVTQTLASFGKDAAKGVGDALLKNILAGRHPYATAREMVKAWGVSLTRAMTISRTEHLRAHRMATLAGYRNNEHIVRGWIWYASLEPNTCLGCMAMHGTRHPLTETLDDHPNGGCAMIPITPSWEELGFTDMPETRLDIPTGESWFGKLTETAQRGYMGDTLYEGWKAGSFDFSQLAKETHNLAWGRTITQAAIKDVMGA